MERRDFVKSMAAAAAPLAQAQTAPQWGGPVLDTHFHLRKTAEDCVAHLEGCGVTHAVLLARAADQERARQAMERSPGRFARSVSVDPASPEMERTLRAALEGGAVSVGELKFPVALDSPGMRRLYDIAAEMKAPVLVHIQTFPHFEGEPAYNTGYPQFDRILKAHPRTTFLGHADLFWANISAEVPADRGYPTGPIRRGGLTDRWLADFPNLYADLSANSGNNALSRDPAFTKEFLARHKNKLIFGSDCACADGKGAGISQGKNPEAARMAGKCVARETLGLLRGAVAPDVFRKLVWENGVRVFRLKF